MISYDDTQRGRLAEKVLLALCVNTIPAFLAAGSLTYQQCTDLVTASITITDEFLKQVAEP